jgi:hypothetical protein
MAPFTFAFGVRYPLPPAANVVGPLYAGSELLLAATGCVIVLDGHCTLNDCAFAGSADKHITPTRIKKLPSFLLVMRPPLPLPLPAFTYFCCGTY